MRVIVSDTSPIRYLVMIGEAGLLQLLYGRVFIPQAVALELRAKHTPEQVRQWMDLPPEWLEIIPTNPVPDDVVVAPGLDPGELHVILLAMRLQADLILMDERAGVHESRILGLTVTGTLGVLARSAERGWLDLKPALDKLQRTNFRVHPQIIHDLLQADSDRKKRHT